MQDSSSCQDFAEPWNKSRNPEKKISEVKAQKDQAENTQQI